MWRLLRSRGADRRGAQCPMSDPFPLLRHTLRRSLHPHGLDQEQPLRMVWTSVAEPALILYKPPAASLDETKSRQARRSLTTSLRPPANSGWLVSFVVPVRKTFLMIKSPRNDGAQFLICHRTITNWPGTSAL